MKRVLFSLLFLAAPLSYGQTSAPLPSGQELLETVNILKGRVDDLTDANHAQARQLQDLQAKVNELTAQIAKPSGNYASQEDLKALQTAITEVDKKRRADNEETLKTLNDLAKITASRGSVAPAPPHSAPHPDPVSNAGTPPTPTPDGPGFTTVARPGDTLVKISNRLFKEQHVRVSVDDILKANPFLKGEAKNLKEGNKLFIPAPKGADSADAAK